MQTEDYPSIFRVADKSSKQGQRWHLWLTRTDLAMTVVAAGVAAAASLLDGSAASVVASVSVFLFAVSIVVKLVIRNRRYDVDWFDGRAVAESVKIETWRYMMRARPFQGDDGVIQAFVRELQAIRSERPTVRVALNTSDDSADLITPRMQEVRGMSAAERRQLYIAERLSDQIDWYTRRARAARASGERWFWFSLGAQGFAFALAIVRIMTPFGGINLVGFIASLATAFTAWSQAIRADELATSYSLAAQELTEIREIARDPAGDESFDQTVQDAESCISREHSLWVAKRSERLPRRLIP